LTFSVAFIKVKDTMSKRLNILIVSGITWWWRSSD
jgi:hypothetical protein